MKQKLGEQGENSTNFPVLMMQVHTRETKKMPTKNRLREKKNINTIGTGAVEQPGLPAAM